ncbi:protein psiJ-like [Mercenaria mercenaria]|uniref:protein psiJ-like n=1 Tax=Mercenaria mercenaria TaxID=6596 RepID=UPI00234F7FDC|nr:protein psiJ-like [Mercenaria mercenaria]
MMVTLIQLTGDGKDCNTFLLLILTMDGLNPIFLLVCFTSAALAYECVEKSCYLGECSPETTCTADATKGCLIERISGDFSIATHNCSSLPCVPKWSNLTDNEYTTDCCFSDKCNDDSMASNTVDDPAVDECYSISCNNEGCLSDAISEGKARLCPAFPDWGCTTTKTNEMYTTSCSQGPCHAAQIQSMKIECCTGNLCNLPTATPTTDDPDAEKCYSITCEGEGCLTSVINEGSPGLCSIPTNGYCTFTKVTGENNVETAGCGADTENMPTLCSNMAAYDFPDGMNIVSQCCNTDRCNDGNIKRIPNVEYCYSVTCNETGCIEEAIQKGIVVYCPQIGFGCMTTSTGGLYITTCAPQQCQEIDALGIKVECCSGDFCNGPPVRTTLTTQSSARTSTEETGTSSTGTSGPTGTTKKDTSGAGRLGHLRYIICTLVTFLVTIIS